MSGSLEGKAETLRLRDNLQIDSVRCRGRRNVPSCGEDQNADPESSFKVTVSDYFTLAATDHVYIFTQKPSFFQSI